MRAVVLRAPRRPVGVETVLLDPPGAGEVLVRVAAAGVCHSDVHLADGLLGEGRCPLVLGHEGAGVVEAVGDGVAGVRPGDHVVFSIVPSCGVCTQCRSGRPTLCEPASRNIVAGTLMDGSSRLRTPDGTMLQHGFMVACFAEYAVVASGGAVRVPASIPLWQAALLGCGVITGIGAVGHAGVGAGDNVCVIGCGGVGLQVIAGARMAGAARIVAIDRDTEKLERALARGATDAINAADGDPIDALLALTGGGVDRAFEVVGDPTTIRQAWDALAPGGKAVVVGVAPRGALVSLPAGDFLDQKTITGSYYGSGDVAAAVAAASELAIQGRLALEEVVSHVIELDQVESALERLRRGEGARSVVVVDDGLAGCSG